MSYNSGSDLDSVKTQVSEPWNHVYAERPFRGGNTVQSRAAENPDSVLNELEKAVRAVWNLAEEENLESVLEQEGAPRPHEVYSRYGDQLVDQYNGVEEFDTYGFEEAYKEVYGYYEVLEDLIQVRRNGF